MSHHFMKMDYGSWVKVSGCETKTRNTLLIIVIPAMAEEDILNTVHSLNACTNDGFHVICIILINESILAPVHIKTINQECYKQLRSFLYGRRDDPVRFHILYIVDIPDKFSGVGLARKLAMDRALSIFEGDNHLKDGYIVNLDADCTVSLNYLNELNALTANRHSVDLYSIFFEHPVKNRHADLPAIEYELHLRYFIGMQRWLKLPYAYQTIGSAFAVRASAYKQMGGMNVRKAGEDFYFIQKFAKKDSIADLNSITVYPLGRSSERVPFGTGRAIMERKKSEHALTSYHPLHFEHLGMMVADLKKIYVSRSPVEVMERWPEPLVSFLSTQNFDQNIRKIQANTRSFTSFVKAFFQWFDAFRLMKYLHFARDHYQSNIDLVQAVVKSSKRLGIPNVGDDKYVLLMSLRKKDRNTVYKGINEVLALTPESR